VAGDAGARLRGARETRLADGQPVLEVSQLADARGFVRARRVLVSTGGETLLADVDPHGRIIRAAFDALTPVDVAPLLAPGAALAQADVDRLRAGVTAAIPGGAEEIRLEVDPDGARRDLTRRIGGVVVERRRYDIDPTGRAVETGSGRRDDVDGLPLELRGDALGYDAWRRLARVVRGTTTVAEIAYDALGRIAGVTTPAGSWDLLHAGGDLVEVRARGAPSAQLVRLPGGPLVETGLPSAPLRALLDGQGSLVGLADAGGAVVASALWDPFGERRRTTGRWPVVGPSFQGLLAVPGLDLLLTPARTLEPRGGAFLEPDPLGFPDGLNRRLYAAGNPLVLSDPSGLLAEPADMAGRPRGLGYAFGYGSNTVEDAWYWRSFLAIAGAFTSLAAGIVDFGLMLVDLEGLWLDCLTGGWLDYRAKSGIGQAAQRGEIGWGLDVLRVMGQGIVDTPGRWYSAVERGDYGAFGAESVNFYSLLRGGHGLARGAWGVRTNLSLRVQGRLGRRAPLWRRALREEQTSRLQPRAARLAGVDERTSGGPRVIYQDRIPAGAGELFDAQYTHGTDTITISEAAFRPFGRIGAYQGSGWRKWRWEIGNVLRGNYTLRVLAHENFHRAQFLDHQAAYLRFRSVPYPFDPREFSTSFLFDKAPWRLGAWDFEMTVPAGPLSTGVGGLGLWLLGFSGKTGEEE
jgi:RHS repeat-associated protein